MILTEEQVKNTIKKIHLEDTDMLDLIETYVAEKKHQTVHLERPHDLINIQLMQVAYEKAVRYYTKKYQE